MNTKNTRYDTDSGLYYIGQRWYDPERGRYISSASPEMLLQNAGVVFALNLYSFCISNPIAVLFAMSTYKASLDFYFDGEYTNWWDLWGKWVVFGIGVVAAIVACIFATPAGGAATATTVFSTLGQIAESTVVGAAISLAIGGTIAGIVSAVTGHDFWQGFEDYVSENWVDALIISFAFSAVTVAASNAIQHFQCFKEGTLVETEDGLKPIEEIQVGDKVLAYDEETGEQGYKAVKQLFRNKTNEWYHIYVNEEEIICTAEHPFYVVGKGFICARDLEVCDTLLQSDNKRVIIYAIEIEQLNKPEATYNFEVEDFHTYYVTESKILVHNKCLSQGSHDFELDPRSIEQAKEGDPSWETFRKRVWQNEAKFNSSNYTSEQLARMSKGLAPKVDGASMQLHHVVGKANDA